MLGGTQTGEGGAGRESLRIFIRYTWLVSVFHDACLGDCAVCGEYRPTLTTPFNSLMHSSKTPPYWCYVHKMATEHIRKARVIKGRLPSVLAFTTLCQPYFLLHPVCFPTSACLASGRLMLTLPKSCPRTACPVTHQTLTPAMTLLSGAGCLVSEYLTAHAPAEQVQIFWREN